MPVPYVCMHAYAHDTSNWFDCNMSSNENQYSFLKNDYLNLVYKCLRYVDKASHRI